MYFYVLNPFNLKKGIIRTAAITKKVYWFYIISENKSKLRFGMNYFSVIIGGTQTITR